jgi:hypothetical protein
MGKITEQSIRKFAQQNSLSQLHKNYHYTAKNRPDLKNHNGFYGNIIYFLKSSYKQSIGKSSSPPHFNFESTFIDELFKIESSKQIDNFIIQCHKYDAVTSKLDQSKVNDLWIEFGKVMNHSQRVLEDVEQQGIIRSFHNLYAHTHQNKDFLISSDQTAFRLYLMDKKPVNLQFYRTYLYNCEEHNGVYRIPKEVAKREFHKFNVWLDGFYKQNKIGFRLEDEEKRFYLYLLKETNDVCHAFASYFTGKIDIKWWGLDEDRSKSLKQSNAYLRALTN